MTVSIQTTNGSEVRYLESESAYSFHSCPNRSCAGAMALWFTEKYPSKKKWIVPAAPSLHVSKDPQPTVCTLFLPLPPSPVRHHPLALVMLTFIQQLARRSETHRARTTKPPAFPSWAALDAIDRLCIVYPARGPRIPPRRC